MCSDFCLGQSAIAGVQWRIALPEKDLALKKSGGRNLTADLKEKTIQLWFDMWLKQKDLGIDNIFTENAVYTESWGPEYHTRQLIKHWFQEWNTRGKVVTWEIKQFFHKKTRQWQNGISKMKCRMAAWKNLMGVPLWNGQKTGK